MPHTQHICTLPEVENSLKVLLKKEWTSNLRKLILISPQNPLCAKHFRSDKAIRREMKRHIEESKCYIIHPLSKFRAWYEIYLILLYSVNFAYKPMVSGFLIKYEDIFNYIPVLSWVLVCLNYFDVFMYLTTGYLAHKSNAVELRPNFIVRNYVCSRFFFSDIVSSLPRVLPYYDYIPVWWFVVLNILCFFKIFRLRTLIACVHRSVAYLRWNIKDKLFLIDVGIITFVISHYLVGLRNMIPLMGYHLWYNEAAKEKYKDIVEMPFSKAYSQSMLAVGGQIFGLTSARSRFPEDYLFKMFTYAFGRVLRIGVWIILAIYIMSKRSMEIKFVEIINQLQAYMSHKGYPRVLRKKMKTYYLFKYQNKFFKEKYVHDLLSPELQREVNLHACKSLLMNVNIFSNMTPEQITILVSKLSSEIFLPGETIYRAGTDSEYMYFISSGTVALYTRSGKEVCHIQEGGFFNEITLIIKSNKHVCTVVSIETTEVYLLSKKDFNSFLSKCKNVYPIILEQAEHKLKYITRIERQYKKQQFEFKFGGGQEHMSTEDVNSYDKPIRDQSSEKGFHLGQLFVSKKRQSSFRKSQSRHHFESLPVADEPKTFHGWIGSPCNFEDKGKFQRSEDDFIS